MLEIQPKDSTTELHSHPYKSCIYNAIYIIVFPLSLLSFNSIVVVSCKLKVMPATLLKFFIISILFVDIAESERKFERLSLF
jgi:hypothetical protein